jgi:integrase
MPRAHLTPTLLQKPVTLLTVNDLRGFRDGLVDGRAPATVNRVVSVLAAALELAASKDQRITNNSAWRLGLQKLPDASRNPRNVVLPENDIRRIVALAYQDSTELGRLVEVAAVTGARVSQIARLRIADLQDDRRESRLMMPTSAKGRGVKRIDRRAVAIPATLAARLREAAGDRAADARLVLKPSGEPWASKDHSHPFARVVDSAGLDPTVVTIYALRHSSITRQLLANVPIRVVADSHDTSVQQIEATYSHCIAEHSDTLSRRALLDLDAPAKVVPLARAG